MTRNFSNPKDQALRRLQDETRRLTAEKEMLTAFCMFLMAALGLVLILI